jgi:uncharacterized protein YktA (UPF0223 family)
MSIVTKPVLGVLHFMDDVERKMLEKKVDEKDG